MTAEWQLGYPVRETPPLNQEENQASSSNCSHTANNMSASLGVRVAPSLGTKSIRLRYPVFPTQSLYGSDIGEELQTIISNKLKTHFPTRKALKAIALTLVTGIFGRVQQFTFEPKSGYSIKDSNLIRHSTCEQIPIGIPEYTLESVIAVAGITFLGLTVAFEIGKRLPFTRETFRHFGSDRNITNHLIRKEIESTNKNPITGKTVYLLLKSSDERLKPLLYELSFDQIIQGLKECNSHSSITVERLLSRSYSYFDPFLKDIFKSISDIHFQKNTRYPRDIEDAILADGELIKKFENTPYLLEGLIAYLKILHPNYRFRELKKIQNKYAPDLNEKLNRDIITITFKNKYFDISKNYLKMISTRLGSASENPIKAPIPLKELSNIDAEAFMEFCQAYLDDRTFILDQENIYDVITVAHLLKSEKVLITCLDWCITNFDDLSIKSLPINVFAELEWNCDSILKVFEQKALNPHHFESFLFTNPYADRVVRLLKFLKHTGLGQLEHKYYHHFIELLEEINNNNFNYKPFFLKVGSYEEEVLQALIDLKKIRENHFLDAFELMKQMYERFVNTRRSLYNRIRIAKDCPNNSLETISLNNFFATEKGIQMLAKHCFGFLPPF